MSGAISAAKRWLIVIVAALALVVVAAPKANADLGDLLGGGADGLIDDTAGDAQESLCGAARRIDGILGGETGVGDAACGLGALDAKFVTVYGTGRNAQPARVHQPVLLVAPNPLDVDGDPAPDLVARVGVSAGAVTLDIDRASGETSQLPVRVELVIKDPTGDLPRERIFFGYDARHDRAPAGFHASTPLSALDLLARGLDDLAFPRGGGSDGGEAVAPSVSVDWAVVNPGAGLGITGGLFNGPPKPEERVDPISGRLYYAPVPADGGVDLWLSHGGYRGVITRGTASSEVQLDVNAKIADQRDVTDVAGTITDLPDRLELHYSNEDGLRSGRYDGSTGFDWLYADYQSKTDGQVTDHAFVTANGLPQGLSFTQKGLGPRSGQITTTGGPVTSARVGYANRRGWPRFLSREDPYAYVVADGGLESYALKVKDLLEATFRAEKDSPVSLDARFLEGGRPFLAQVETGATRELPPLNLKALVRYLPNHISASFDPETGNVEYDGFGAGIDLIHADVKALSLGRDPILGGEPRPPLFGRVRHIVGELRGLPSKLTAQVLSGSSGFEGFRFTNHEDELVEPRGPLRSAEIMLTDAPEDDPAAWGNVGGLSRLLEGRSGGSFVDTPRQFEVFGRLRNLRSGTLSTLQRVRLHKEVSPVGPSVIRRNIELDAKFDGPREPFVAHVERGATPSLPAFTADAYLSNLARELSLTVNPTRGSVDYHGSNGIDLIHTDIQAQEPLFERVRHVVGQIDRLPPDVTTRVASGTQGFEGLDFVADPGLHQVELMMTNSRPGQDPARWSRPDGLDEELRVEEGPDQAGRPVSGASLTALPGDERRRFQAFGRLRGPKRFSFGVEPLSASLETTVRQPLHVLATYDKPGDRQAQGHTQATLRELPTTLTIDSPGPGLDGFRYQAAQTVGSLDVLATNLPGDSAAAAPHNIRAHVSGIPNAFTAFLGCSGGKADAEGRCPGEGSSHEILGVDTPRPGPNSTPTEGSIGRISARAWRTGQPEPSAVPGSRNLVEARALEADPRTLRPNFSVRAGMSRLREFTMAAAPETARIIRTRLASSEVDPLPTEFDVSLGGGWRQPGPVFDSVLHAKGILPRPPKEIQVTSNKNGLIDYVASSRQQEVKLGVMVESLKPEYGFRTRSNQAAVGMRIIDVPMNLRVCATGKPGECDQDAPDRFRVDPPAGSNKDMVLKNDLNAYIDVPEGADRPPPTITTAKVCLVEGRVGNMPDAAGCLPDSGPFTRYTSRRDVPRAADPTLLLENVEVRDLDFEFGSGEAKVPGSDRPGFTCGDVQHFPTRCDDDLLKLWLDTPSRGLLFDAITYSKTPGARLMNASAPRLTADGFFLVLDLTKPPTGEEEASRGSIDCEGLTIEIIFPAVPLPDLDCDDVHHFHENG